MSRARDQAGDSNDVNQGFRQEFRRHLEIFYAKLKLAPPYHTIEKAILALSQSLNQMTLEDRERVVADPALQWAQYRAAFIKSGLNLKHRGIISGMVKAGRTSDLPTEYESFLSAFQQ